MEKHKSRPDCKEIDAGFSQRKKNKDFLYYIGTIAVR